ncbi:MAG: PrsW family intramembrane metalloprotease [Pegethrix bostrychoides GSE-TBD4-15B]|jgi:RsiW-degrading membrane proteinase PrsW (M82 family)|uniref:PrsW family intramembrane metalloprotease n=1 Tax=Pegethrix bostrychoides GSE-TBD4-15B TaxID=2839662 RepID=A0A951P9S3_9CYAN|nr:PrsW family intramembrane metalloprotease [Pegethrix bostrychoides GSE-TBD4-15B]
MMQADLLKLAQQGDLTAIARLLNSDLQPRGVTAKLLMREQRLKILLFAERSLDQTALVKVIQQRIDGLAIRSVALVKLYSQRVGREFPDWTFEFTPASYAAPASPEPVAAAATLAATAAATAAATVAAAAAKSTTAIVKVRTESQDFLASLRTFQLDSIFPYREVLSLALYRSSRVRLLLFLGLFPLVINLIAERVSLEQTAWLLGIYYASIWGVVLYNLIKPVQFSWQLTLICVLFTTGIGIPMLLILQQVPPFRSLYHAIEGGLLFRIVGFILGVGVLEEICKALPVYLLVFYKKLRDPLSTAFYGAMSGLGFAIAEGVAYSFRYASGLSKGQLELGSYVAANTIRFVSLPLFHAILAGIVGYFIGLTLINPSRRSALCFVGVLIAATLHGLYNTFAGGLPGLLIVGFAILLFVAYLRRSQQIVTEMHLAEQNSRR